jgi:very-short-patch-repair endonuclease
LIEWDPWRIEVTVPGPRVARSGIAVHRSRLIHPEDRTAVDGLPVTSVARTIVDLADVMNDRQLERVVRRAEILRVFDLKQIDQTLEHIPGRRGRHRLKRVLAAYQPEPRLLRSKAERRLKELCEDHSLPQPQFNVQLHGYEVDVYWPHAALVVEVDGAATHHTTAAFHNDRRRDRALAAHGIQVLRVTWPDLHHELADQLREILRRR